MVRTISLFLLFVVSYLQAGDIVWMDNFDQAVSVAKKEKKPMLLFFTGSDWCPWCKKMDTEVFKDKAFSNAVGSDFVFVLIDFPSKTDLSDEVTKQNQRLQKTYDIQGFPTIILVDPDKGVITRMGYVQGGGKKYAEQLKKVLAQLTKLHVSFDRTPNGKDLEDLYHVARELGCPYWVDKIFQKGLKADLGPFFLLEKYCALLDEGKIESDDAKEIKIEIQLRDPKNLKGSLFRLAVLEFQARITKEGFDPELATAPLIQYLADYRYKDKENVWRLEMMIAQYLFTHGQPEKALQHARACFKAAPDDARKEIADSISYIRTHLKSSKA